MATTILFLAVSRAALAGCEIGVLGELPVTMSGTRPVVTARVEGNDARFLADSGAFFSSLTKPAVAKFGLRPSALPFGFVVSGVGGRSTAELATVKEFTLSGVHGASLHRVQFLVIDNLHMGGVDGIIGQNILRIGDTEYDLANGVIRLVRQKGCNERALVYWTRSDRYGVVTINPITPQESHILGSATIDGQKIRVLFDTGASTSILARRVAAKVGVTPETDGTVRGGYTGGVGRHLVETWLAPFRSLDLGGETIKNIRIRFGDLDELDGIDMLLGADFFLSHRVYVAKSQSRLYFTYNGGPVFDLRVRSEPSPAATSAATAPAADTAAPAPTTSATPPDQFPAAAGVPEAYSDAPTDAAGFRRRGAAFMARGEMPSALQDYDHAIELDPTVADGYYDRAVARLRARQPDLAIRDLDETLRRQPADARALMLRGELRLARQDLSGARSDFDDALQAVPEDASLELRIASAYERAGQSREAIPRLDAWIAAHPKSPARAAILNSRCWARARLGEELDLALADCDAAIRQLPRAAPILNSRGLVHLRRGELEAAIRDYKASLAVNPKEASSLYGLGIAELRRGLKDLGNRDLRAALELQGSIATEYQRMGMTP